MVRLRGLSGALLVSYQQAAELVSWELEVLGPGSYGLQAALRQVSGYWMRQQPMHLRLELPGAKPMCWRVPVAPVVSNDGTVRLRLEGAPVPSVE